MRIEQKLLRMAARQDACRAGLDKLAGMTDRNDMVNLYLENIDFCLSNDFPDNAVIAADFGDVINDWGIYLNNSFEALNRPKIVLLGASHGKVQIDGYNVAEIFVKHDSILDLTASGNAFVMVDVFDETILEIHAHDRAKVCVNRYGGEIRSECADEAQIKVREKHKKTY